MRTAVEWFNEQIKLNAEFREIFKGRVSFTIGESKIEELLEQAKEMEKEQIIDAVNFGDTRGKITTYSTAEQYYNETFKSE
jgi:Ni,Fe-hydrogenase maturation factor